jgi:hypothetical protein
MPINFKATSHSSNSKFVRHNASLSDATNIMPIILKLQASRVKNMGRGVVKSQIQH